MRLVASSTVWFAQVSMIARGLWECDQQLGKECESERQGCEYSPTLSLGDPSEDKACLDRRSIIGFVGLQVNLGHQALPYQKVRVPDFSKYFVSLATDLSYTWSQRNSSRLAYLMLRAPLCLSPGVAEVPARGSTAANREVIVITVPRRILWDASSPST